MVETVKEKLSSFHTLILIYITQTGVVIISLGQMLAQTFGYNGWLALPFYFAAVTVNLLLIGLVYRMGKGQSIFCLMERRIPKLLLSPLYLTLIAVWCMLATLVAKEYVLIFQMIAFPTTNPIWFKLVIDSLAYMLFIKGIYTISKAGTLFFWMTIWMYVLSCMFFSEFNWNRLTPFVFSEGDFDPKGITGIYTAFLGYELTLLLFAYVDRSVKLLRISLIANSFVFICYIYISIVVFGFFGPVGLRMLLFPLIDMFAFIKFPFIERIENLLYGLLLFTMLATISMYLWSANETSGRLFPKIPPAYRGLVLITGSFFAGMLPGTLSDVNEWLTWFGIAEIGISFGLPLFLVALLLIRKEKGTSVNA